MKSGRLKQGSAIVSNIILVLDALTVWQAAELAAWLRFGGWSATLPLGYDSLIVATSLLAMLCSSLVYQSFRGGSWQAMYGRVVLAWLITVGMLLAWLFFSKSSEAYSRIFVGTWVASMLPLLLLQRTLVMLVLRWLHRRGVNTREVLLIGKGPMSNDLAKRAREASWSGFKVTRQVSATDLDRIAQLASDATYDEVWINLPAHETSTIPAVLEALKHSAADIRVVPDLLTYRMINHGVTFIMGVPMLDISGSALGGVNRVIKQIEDYILASVILLLISPLMAAIAMAIKLTSPGPVIFKQKRHGWGGEEIVVYKFRSMTVHQEHDKVTQATKNDARITPLGAFLRRTSLDELPQFINVLQGRMSIVGPRPHAIQHNHYYKELIPNYMLRHKMKPGITGWAQVNGLRGETDTIDKMKSRVDYDLHYLEHWSVWLDLRIVFLTVFKGFVHKNAY